MLVQASSNMYSGSRHISLHNLKLLVRPRGPQGWVLLMDALICAPCLHAMEWGGTEMVCSGSYHVLI